VSRGLFGTNEECAVALPVDAGSEASAVVLEDGAHRSESSSATRSSRILLASIGTMRSVMSPPLPGSTDAKYSNRNSERYAW
jgi:hypothetical protein